ncbi:metalloprotease [Leptodontidium sp. 2 PMI_412]|nr:metalloprotease [Leptodontidium sp. 2 PMI_412]
MVRLTLLASLLAGAITTVYAHPQPRDESRQIGCGTEPPAEFLDAASQISAWEAEIGTNATRTDSARAATVTIDTYIHVVARSTALSGGYVPAAQLTNQISVLNEHYAPAGFQFKLISTDYTVNTAWAADVNGNDVAMKRALRKGTYSSLNIYFQYTVSGYLGYAQFPQVAAVGSTDYITDGLNILYTTTPGGSLRNYNLGGTVTHEVGHWLGLFHVFQGGCTGSGDMIADTPPQSTLTDGCPVGQDSCPGGGVDSIHNYMDYSYDSCYESFTPNQITRMVNMWSTYRAGL